jgi:hypothetical protein
MGSFVPVKLDIRALRRKSEQLLNQQETPCWFKNVCDFCSYRNSPVKLCPDSSQTLVPSRTTNLNYFRCSLNTQNRTSPNGVCHCMWDFGIRRAGVREYPSDTECSTMRIIILPLVMLQLTGIFEPCKITEYLRREQY